MYSMTDCGRCNQVIRCTKLKAIGLHPCSHFSPKRSDSGINRQDTLRITLLNCRYPRAQFSLTLRFRQCMDALTQFTDGNSTEIHRIFIQCGNRIFYLTVALRMPNLRNHTSVQKHFHSLASRIGSELRSKSTPRRLGPSISMDLKPGLSPVRRSYSSPDRMITRSPRLSTV